MDRPRRLRGEGHQIHRGADRPDPGRGGQGKAHRRDVPAVRGGGGHGVPVAGEVPGMDRAQLRKLKQLEVENRGLKRIMAREIGHRCLEGAVGKRMVSPFAKRCG